MKAIQATGGIILIVLCLISFGSAEETVAASQVMYPWNSIWETESYFMTITQNESVISGIYEPKEGIPVDMGVLEGTISADGKTFSGIWIETGPVTYTLSDDAMAYTGIIGVSMNGEVINPNTSTTVATRSLPSFDPDQIWTGTWNADRYTVTLVQNGARVTGTYDPLASVNDEPGVLEGVVSEDGRTFSAIWREWGNFSFTLSDDRTYFNGTYTWKPGLDAPSDSWNGIRKA